MKTLLLLHREELTLLYSNLSLNINDRLHVINVAYSLKEVSMLHNAGIHVDFVYTSMLEKALDKQGSINDKMIKSIDDLVIKNSNGRFTLNGSLQSDRGFSVLTYNETLLLAQANYIVCLEIFNSSHIDILLHEPCSLFFNHLMAMMCKDQGGIYLSQSTAFSEMDQISYINIINDDYTCPEVETNFRYYNEHPDQIDYKRCEAFIRKFRSSYDIFQNNLQPNRSYINFIIKSLKRQISCGLKRNRYNRLIHNVDYWLNKQNPMGKRLGNLLKYRKYGIQFEDPRGDEKYYYYSFHLEPEAVVLYLSGGTYTNQVKLIENIAASLPAGCYLYVKDHPHEFAYRSVDDYIRLSKVPNIRLIRSEIPGKRLIRDSLGVFTINGTAGFEGVMLRKQVYCFGKSYYTNFSQVNYVENIKNLRAIVYSNQEVIYADDVEFMAFVNAYLNSLHHGMVGFFMGLSNSYNGDMSLNCKMISDDLFVFSKLYCVDK